MPDGERYDVVVIGAGPGGYTAALEAARCGFRTALVERRAYLGGVCLNEGCIPSKALLSAADVIETIGRGGVFGVTAGEVHADWSALQARRVEVIQTLRQGVAGLLRAASVEVMTGAARLASATAVEIEQEDRTIRIDADRVVLATGSSPNLPAAWAGLDGVHTSTEMLALGALPASVTIVGGGVIGCEFASMLVRMGVSVRVVEMAERLLPMVDADVAAVLGDRLAEQGVAMRFGARVAELFCEGGVCRVELADGESWESEKVLVAVGRRPNTAGLGLEEAGVGVDARGAVEVDAGLRTALPTVWCIGDANGRTMLAHAAMSQGRHVVRAMLGVEEAYDATVPWCVYTSPELAWVGVSAQEAADRGLSVHTGDFPYAALGKAHASGESAGLFRLVVDAGGVVVGGQVAGAHATELINQVALMVAGRMTVAQAHAVAWAHPTLSEGVGEAASAALGLAVHVPGPRVVREAALVLGGV
ncbi:MAG: dihydrolipoyl dehydrogenase [Planctomycetota bacterium]